MKTLPEPETYSLEDEYMPWGLIIKAVLDLTIKQTPKNGKLIDLMCGPGQLLERIHNKRNDISLTGLDIDKRYIDYATKQFPTINFINEDILNWDSPDDFDICLITGGIHHVPYSQQSTVLKLAKKVLKKNGICVVADPFINDYQNEKQRKIAASKLGYEYIKAVIENDGPDEIISASIDILSNDVLPKGEYKTSIKKMENMVKNIFPKYQIIKTWPKENTEYGDYYFILNN